MRYWVTEDRTKIYVVVPGGYDCYLKSKDLFHTEYYAKTGFMAHLPAPETLVKVEPQTIDSNLYTAAKNRRIL